MSRIARSVFIKAGITAAASLVASFVISFIAVPHMGGTLDGAGLIMTLVLPVVIAFPASAFQFWQMEKTRVLRDQLADALVRLDQVNTQLSHNNMELLRERSHDPLTRLMTADVFDRSLRDQSDRGDLGHLLLLRIDALPDLRRSHGPTAAETAVFAVATSIRGALRPGDFAGRIGEGDFAVFMPGATPILASLAVSSITAAAAIATLPYNGGPPTPTRLSVGGVECVAGFDADPAIAAAATELDRSIANGGNCSHWGKLRSAITLGRPVG